jgi:hypothetical protein
MEQTATTDFNIPDSPESAESCPISELLGKRVTQMNDEELAQHIATLRTSVESPQSLRKMIAKRGSKSSGAAKAPKVNLSLLGDL